MSSTHDVAQRAAGILAALLVGSMLVVPAAAAGSPMVVAHRGDTIAAPENTIPALDLANRAGYAVECDVRYTSDGQPVLLHDATLERTTTGTGPVALVTFAQLRTYTADGATWIKAKVPTLWEGLNAIRGLTGPTIFVELKAAAPNESAVNRLILAIIHTATYRRVVLTGYDAPMLQQVQAYAVAHYGWRPPLGLLYMQPLTAEAVKAAGATWALPKAAVADIAALQAAGLKVGVWTLNDAPAWAGCATADAIITDRPHEVAGWLQ